ncbi:MAG TPA: hypothetical protein VGX92_03605 [Pyrinomonadaceae bacterium]|nr:hypothetical protein [Pyrinomonadaceae bacterium]
MKTSEAILELLIPGMLVSSPIGLLVLRVLGFIQPGYTTEFLAKIPIPLSTIFGILFLGSSYLVGAVLNELGTRIVEKKSNKVVLTCIKAYKDDLIEHHYEELREVDLNKLSEKRAWAEFSFLRAFDRTSSGGAASRIRSHESYLRLFRPSLVSIPLGLIFFGAYTLSVAASRLNSTAIFGYTLVLLSMPSHILLRAVYFQRLNTAVKSAIQHYTALKSQEESDD